MIAHAKSEDLVALSHLGLKFAEESRLFKVIPQVWQHTWTQLLHSGLGVMLVAWDNDKPIGAIGGIIAPDPNDGEKVLSEAFWFVDPAKRGHGMRLLRAFEDWGRSQNCKRIVMAHLTNIGSKLADIFPRLGYTPVEIHYSKTL